MKTSLRTAWWLAVLLIPVALAVVNSLSGLRSSEANFYDGRHFVVASNLFLKRESPYNLELYRQRMLEFQDLGGGKELDHKVEAFVYPPATLLVFSPLALVDYAGAKKLVNGVNVVIMPLLFWMLLLLIANAATSSLKSPGNFSEKFPLQGRHGAIVITALGVGFLHAAFPATLTLGQSSLMVFLGLAGVALFAQRGGLAAVCLFSLLAFIKPQITLLPILVYLVATRKWRELVWIFITVATVNAAAVAWMYHPGFFEELISAVSRYRSLEPNLDQKTYGALMLAERLQLPKWVVTCITILSIGALGVLSVRNRRIPPHLLLAAAVMVELAFFPLHYYDFVFIPLVLIAISAASPTIGIAAAAGFALVCRGSVTEKLLGIVHWQGLDAQFLHGLYMTCLFVALAAYFAVHALKFRTVDGGEMTRVAQ